MVAKTKIQRKHETWVDIVVEMLPFVEPDFGEAGVVVVDDAARAAGEAVGRGLAEHVAHVRTRRDLQPPAALPHLPRTPHTSPDTSRIPRHLRGFNKFWRFKKIDIQKLYSRSFFVPRY